MIRFGDNIQKSVFINKYSIYNLHKQRYYTNYIHDPFNVKIISVGLGLFYGTSVSTGLGSSINVGTGVFSGMNTSINISTGASKSFSGINIAQNINGNICCGINFFGGVGIFFGCGVFIGPHSFIGVGISY